jgi:AraC-like DNA-binding protein
LPSHDKDLPVRDTALPIRTSILRGISGLIDDLGGRGNGFLEAYGIAEAQTTVHNDYVSLNLVERIIEDAAGMLALPDFGLRMAARQDLHVMGPLAIAMENSHTVGEALECASRFMFVLSPALSHTVIPDPLENPGVLGIRYASTTRVNSPQSIDYGIGLVHRVVTLVSGGTSYGLRSVHLPHPALASESVYREHFGAEVWFDSADAVLRIPRHLMTLPVVGGNEVLLNIAVEHLETHFGHDDVPVTDLVIAVLEGQHGPDAPDLAKVARLLGLHPRSLQRRLAAEGTGVRELVDRVRRDQTERLITTTTLSFSQIAVQVGMGEQTSLSRAVQRWFGTSPSGLRRRSLDEPATPLDWPRTSWPRGPVLGRDDPSESV